MPYLLSAFLETRLMYLSSFVAVIGTKGRCEKEEHLRSAKSVRWCTQPQQEVRPERMRTVVGRNLKWVVLTIDSSCLTEVIQIATYSIIW